MVSSRQGFGVDAVGSAEDRRFAEGLDHHGDGEVAGELEGVGL